MNQDDNRIKVKDAINIWLLVFAPHSKIDSLYTEHYFSNKKKSICGIAKHPKNQPRAIFIAVHRCKTCEKILKSYQAVVKQMAIELGLRGAP